MKKFLLLIGVVALYASSTTVFANEANKEQNVDHNTNVNVFKASQKDAANTRRRHHNGHHEHVLLDNSNGHLNITNGKHHHKHSKNHTKSHKKRQPYVGFRQQNYNYNNYNDRQPNNFNNMLYNNFNQQNGNFNQNQNKKVKAMVNIPDNWDKNPFILQTYNEPQLDTQWYLMPHLSNGILGTTVKNSSIYFNGLYNGFQERSHRVRIPSLTAVEAEFAFSLFNNDVTTYHFDCRRGVYTIERRNNDAIMTQKFYVHRRLKNIIVNEIKVELLASKVSMSVDLTNLTILELNTSYINSPMNPNQFSYYYQKNNPEQMSFEQRVVKEPTVLSKVLIANDGIYYLKATIPQTEINNNRRQKEIHTFYTNIPSKFEVYPNTTSKTFHFIQSVDTDSARARSAYDEALRLISNDPNGLYVLHVAAWEEIWSKAGLAAIHETSYMDSNNEEFKLAQHLYVSFYNLYASIPMSYDSQFYGVSPAGLAYGGLKPEFFNSSSSQFISNRVTSEGYGGHIMFTQELFVLPVISMFNADMSRSIINSRLRRGYNTDSPSVYERAREMARQEDYEGLRYAWEQGDYGVDVSPTQDARKSKIHTSADISYGLRAFLRMSHSNQFLQQSISNEVGTRGEEFINELAKYWYDRMVLDTTTNEYVIKGVSFGEKPQSREIDNELYTNYLASMTMDTYKYVLELQNKNPYETQNSQMIREYDDRIRKIKLPYDSFRNLYLEYDNFATSQQNEETLVPYLNYPILKHFTYSEKKQIYDSYANQLPNDGKNILTYSSYVVGYTELKEDQRAKDYFNRMHNHFLGSFKVLSEYSQQSALSFSPTNTYHYIPGYAAFVQAFLGGYCGLRVQDYQLDLVYPSEMFGQYQSAPQVSQDSIFKQPAANADSWNITGLAYRGNKIDIIYNLRLKSVEIRNRRGNDPLVQGDDSLEVAIYEGSEQKIQSLRVGESVSISLSSETWYYRPKLKSRLQKNRNYYADNMHILASIYSSQHRQSVRVPSSAIINQSHVLFTLAVVIINLKFFKILFN